MRKEFKEVLRVAKKYNQEIVKLLEKVKKHNPNKMSELANHIEERLLAISPALDRAEVRSFSEILTGVAGASLREKQNEIAATMGGGLPDCFRSFCTFEKAQQNNEVLLNNLQDMILEWQKNGGKDLDGTIENKITYIKMLASINNMLLPTSKKDLDASKSKNWFMKISN